MLADRRDARMQAGCLPGDEDLRRVPEAFRRVQTSPAVDDRRRLRQRVTIAVCSPNDS